MSVYASIDVGSNSVLVHVAKKHSDGSFEVLGDKAEVSRLGEGLQKTGVFSNEAMERTLAALKDFRTFMNEHHVEEMAAVGTMALRNAKNAPEFIQRVKEETGIAIEVIPGEEEARLSYLAVKSGLPSEVNNIVLFDVGGGSTEFIYGTNNDIDDKFSLNIGALRLTDDYLKTDPVTKDELSSLLNDLNDEFAPLKAAQTEAVLVGMGGAITNMTAVMHKMKDYDPSRIQGSRISTEEINRQLELFRTRTIEERRNISGLQPKRAETILAGAAIVSTVMNKIGKDSVFVSDRGIRHGLMADRFAK